MSRSPAGTSTTAAAATAVNTGGYSSDTGYLESSSRAGSRHRANYDYDTFQSRISPTAAQQQRLEKQEQQQQQHVSSSSRVSGAGESAGEKETIEEKYHKTYKEEYSSGSH